MLLLVPRARVTLSLEKDAAAKAQINQLPRKSDQGLPLCLHWGREGPVTKKC